MSARSRHLARIVAVTLALGGLASLSRADELPALELARTLPLPGVAGRIDHLAVDAQHERVFIAALGNDSVEVLGAQRAERLATLALERPTGIAYDAAANRLWVAGSEQGVLASFDGTSYEPLGTLRGLPDADNLRVDASAARVYVGYGDGAIAIIDAKTLQRVGELALPGHPESFQLEARGRRVFANVPDAGAIVAAARAAPAQRSVWPLGALRGNFALALDEAHARLFAAFRRPARLVAFATASSAHAGELPLCADSDDLFYDAARQRIYAVCGDGNLDVIAAPVAGELRRVARVATRAGARTGAFCAETGELYVAAPRQSGREAEILVYRARP